MRVERCSPDRESRRTTSLSPTPTLRRLGLPTTERCLQTSATSSVQGNGSAALILRNINAEFISYHHHLLLSKVYSLLLWVRPFWNEMKSAHPWCSFVVSLLHSGTEERTTCSACWQDTVSLQGEWLWGRDSTTTPTSPARPSAWPLPSTTRSWNLRMVRWPVQIENIQARSTSDHLGSLPCDQAEGSSK